MAMFWVVSALVLSHVLGQHDDMQTPSQAISFFCVKDQLSSSPICESTSSAVTSSLPQTPLFSSKDVTYSNLGTFHFPNELAAMVAGTTAWPIQSSDLDRHSEAPQILETALRSTTEPCSHIQVHESDSDYHFRESGDRAVLQLCSSIDDNCPPSDYGLLHAPIRYEQHAERARRDVSADVTIPNGFNDDHYDRSSQYCSLMGIPNDLTVLNWNPSLPTAAKSCNFDHNHHINFAENEPANTLLYYDKEGSTAPSSSSIPTSTIYSKTQRSIFWLNFSSPETLEIEYSRRDTSECPFPTCRKRMKTEAVSETGSKLSASTQPKDLSPCALCGLSRNANGKLELPLDIFSPDSTFEGKLQLMRETLDRYKHHKRQELTTTSYMALRSFKSVIKCYDVHCLRIASEFERRHPGWEVHNFQQWNCSGRELCDYTFMAEQRQAAFESGRTRRNPAKRKPLYKNNPDRVGPLCCQCGIHRNPAGRFVIPETTLAKSVTQPEQLQIIREKYELYKHHRQQDLSRTSYIRLQSLKHILICHDEHCGGNPTEFLNRHPKYSVNTFYVSGCSGTSTCNYQSRAQYRKRKNARTVLYNKLRCKRIRNKPS